jgi:hypothetical protein
MLDPLLKLILDLHPRQYEVFSNPARFRVLVAGRRFGKTHLALTEMLYTAAKLPNSVSWYVGPNNGQSKHIAWDRLKKLTKPYWSKEPNETDLRIDLSNGSTLFVYGAFNPESLRGRGIDFLVLDEFALIDPQAWFSVLRPALADRKGRVLFIGTPQGRNHFFDMYEFAKQTDWATVREFFAKWVGTFAPEYYITSANPPVRDRIACVNRRLRTQAMESRLMVDPKCKELIRDLEDVTWQLDSTGAVTSEINKSDKNRTHTSDALGYFIYQAFPLNAKIGEKPDGPLLSF